MSGLARSDGDELLGRASCRRHAHDAPGPLTEDDRVAAPADAARRRDVTQRFGRASGNRNLLQLPVGDAEEHDRVAVGREDRLTDFVGFGPGNRTELVVREFSNVETVRRRHVGDAGAVGRQSNHLSAAAPAQRLTGRELKNVPELRWWWNGSELPGHRGGQTEGEHC